MPQLFPIFPSSTLYSRNSWSSCTRQVVNMFFTPATQSAMRVISWKWVANRQKGEIWLCKYAQISHAIPKPSLVLVPLPNSSIKTSECLVAVSSIHELSSISLMKVDMPFTCRSEAPTRVIIASMMGVSNSSAGTQHPICAKYVQRPTVRIYVDLPPIFGPVRMMVLCSLKSQSFGIQFLMQTCLIPFPERAQPNRGRHHIPVAVLTTEARVVSTSSSLSRKESSSMTGQQPATSSNIFLSKTCCYVLYSSSTIVSLQQRRETASVIKVILVCFAVRNLQPAVSLTLLMASFLLAQSTNLWVLEGIFSTYKSRWRLTRSIS